MHAVRTPPSTTKVVDDLRSTRRALGMGARSEAPRAPTRTPMRTLPGAVAIWVGLGATGWASAWMALRFVAGQL